MTDVETAEREKRLVIALKQVYQTWPSDGWDGAAAVIAAYAQKAREIESALAELHASSKTHGPEHPYYIGRCCCREGEFSA